MASPEANAALARHFLQAYAARDLATIAGLISDDALLRDWNLERRGREAFLAETRHNFEQAACITIDIEHLHATSDKRLPLRASISVTGTTAPRRLMTPRANTGIIGTIVIAV